MAYYREASATPDPDYDHLFQAIQEEVAAFQATDAGGQFWGLRVIWLTARSQDPRSIIEDADNCVAAKLVWPQLVAGYDLAGAESLGRPLADLLPELFWFRKQCALEGVQVPFFLRAAGDSDAATTTTAADGNLFDALLVGTRRIGGARSLHQHPRLVEAVKDKRILVEISPQSRDGALGPTAPGSSNTMQHDSLSALLAQGVPCALCDDSGQEEHGGGGGSRMTNAFWRALHASCGDSTTDLATLGSLAENSVRWAAFEDQDAELWYVPTSYLPMEFPFLAGRHSLVLFVLVLFGVAHLSRGEEIRLPKRHCPLKRESVPHHGRLADRTCLGRAMSGLRAWGPGSRHRDCSSGRLSGSGFVFGL